MECHDQKILALLHESCPTGVATSDLIGTGTFLTFRNFYRIMNLRYLFCQCVTVDYEIGSYVRRFNDAQPHYHDGRHILAIICESGRKDPVLSTPH